MSRTRQPKPRPVFSLIVLNVLAIACLVGILTSNIGIKSRSTKWLLASCCVFVVAGTIAWLATGRKGGPLVPEIDGKEETVDLFKEVSGPAKIGGRLAMIVLGVILILFLALLIFGLVSVLK